MSEGTDTPEFPEGQISSIPLDRLMLSSLNVRQTERDADTVGLAESIATHGLKQNLIVVPAHFSTGEVHEEWNGADRWAGKFEVIAGGRRFQALQLLVEQDRLPATFPTPCKVESRDQARETSLIENKERVTMNPADELDAYREIVARHSGNPKVPSDAAIEICAKRFGKTVRYVEGRLRLANLAPEILAALRADEIGLESAKAYAAVEDHELQLQVFEAQKKSKWKAHHASIVRDALNGHSLAIDHDLVKFVGLDAYLAAGGHIITDLFMGTDGEQRVTDVKLVEEMARKLAEPMVAPQAKKDGFKSGMLATVYGGWPKAPEGMERFQRYYADKDPTKAELKKCIAVYGIEIDGTGIAKLGHFRPIPVKEQQPERDWEAERAANSRSHAVKRRAARLAIYELGKFTGTPLEGHAFWPDYNPNVVELDRSDEAFTFVAVLIRVPTERVEANREEAERLIDEEAAAAAAAQAEEDAEDEGADA
ncbi:ParB/RepB/Spo0J family partition protein [Novosphingobium clariflavum]|uniref:ParB/RepB/Spo0J family partition protein n=1 Tax=Novosphingobium clariflavum TaxID=2029884 RepID=A0ABV6S602_9SPHN|nr:ParB/RepB/Spo0J family partition protein [Novosphingobium clariflavum]